MALISFGLPKYFDERFGLCWPAVSGGPLTRQTIGKAESHLISINEAPRMKRYI
jgi:hypothetical protein